MFDIKRLNSYNIGDTEHDLLIEIAGNSSNLNAFFHLEIYYTKCFNNDMNNFCLYIPDNLHPEFYWKLVVHFINEDEYESNLEEFFSYIEHLNDLEEPVINTNFNWSDYEIPNYVWIAITGLIVTAI